MFFTVFKAQAWVYNSMSLNGICSMTIWFFGQLNHSPSFVCSCEVEFDSIFDHVSVSFGNIFLFPGHQVLHVLIDQIQYYKWWWNYHDHYQQHQHTGHLSIAISVFIYLIASWIANRLGNWSQLNRESADSSMDRIVYIKSSLSWCVIYVLYSYHQPSS